jgi:signal transduction histidine kinase
MARLRLKTQLLISTLLIICALTGAILLIVRHTVRSEIDGEVQESTLASVDAFQVLQQERELQLSRTAAMLSELPTLKALMSTQHVPTIQDASTSVWQLAGSDLFLLADPGGGILGLHVTRPGLDSIAAEADLAKSLKEGSDAAWWYVGERLYWTFLRPITAGSGRDAKQLGLVAIGYQLDSTVASDLARASDSRIVFAAGDKIIASSLAPQEETELQQLELGRGAGVSSAGREVTLSGTEYQVASIALRDGPPLPVQCYVLVSLRRPMSFIRKLNRTILVLGISAVLFAWLLLSSVSRAITRPVDNLVAGVRALAAGDYAYSITPRGSSEVAELGEAFSKMRGELLASERQRLETERIAALGMAASSISHDLRHYLATVVANAEFLYEAEKLKLDKDDIYGEIKLASEQMTELLDSLRELAREQRTISPCEARMDRIVHRATEAVLSRPELRQHAISIHTAGDMNGVFDARKMERVFFNLLLNASEATAADRQGVVTIDISSGSESFEIRVADNGSGIPAAIRKTLFDPFVSSGKSNGTGLGLAIASKIIHDHYGSIVVERTSELGTVFLIRLPRSQPTTNELAEAVVT